MKLNIKTFFTNFGMVAAAIAIILLLLPHDDRQSYVYELNQPWRYQLLTADFDMPILRDSTSARQMRDSIDRAFIPFVKRNEEADRNNVTRFEEAAMTILPAQRARLLSEILADTYKRGIVDNKTYEKIQGPSHGVLREEVKINGSNSVETIDAAEMLPPAKAFTFIDSVYHARITSAHADTIEKLSPELIRIISEAISPNVVPDTVSNDKFREQEYLTVNGALGVIKTGQRIVDRGEIITPQIFTNLNTYLEMAARNGRVDGATTYYMVGQGLYLLVCFIALYVFLYICRRKFVEKIKNMVFLITFITAFTLFAILMFEYVGNGIYFVPFAAIPIVILVFFDSRTAIFSLLIAVMMSALVAIMPFQFIFMELAAGLTAAFTLNTLERRSQLLRSALFTFIAYVISYVIIMLIQEGNLAGFDWHIIGVFGINAVILSFAYFLVLIIEKVFGFTSMVTLVELSDINNPLLRKLAEDAPGTFQHSMQVSTLAAEAARAVGANTQLVRVGALYHDIGKLDGPIFYTENQHGISPHTGLNPETSAHKIISHVTTGVTLAQKYNLPEEIRSFITQHHGRSVARYFYNTAVNNNPDGTVDKSKFTYPGPDPQSAETAILMMADSVEAASRSLPEYTPEAINNLVDKIVDSQVAEGRFNESPISFRDIQKIKQTFKKRLSTIYHSRVAYPELKKKAEADARSHHDSMAGPG